MPPKYEKLKGTFDFRPFVPSVRPITTRPFGPCRVNPALNPEGNL